MRYIGAYFKEKRGRLVLDACYVSIFLLCYMLSGINANAFWYPAGLCIMLWSIYTIIDIVKFSNRLRELKNAENHVDETHEDLPEPEGCIEQQYQRLIEMLSTEDHKKHQALKNKLDGDREYITLWAHQIKTPLTALELMVQDIDEDNVYERSREITMKLFEVEQYVDSTLQYMRMDSMSSDMLLKEYELFSIVKQAVKYYSKTFIMKHISLNLCENDVRVITDEKWLVFVIKQILSNSLKYTKKGSISIYMEPSREKVLVIEDTGIGIAAEDLPRIYERGFTGYNGRMQKKATGIGLYLSNTILTKLGHSIEISSQEGVGTKVMLDLSRDFEI